MQSRNRCERGEVTGHTLMLSLTDSLDALLASLPPRPISQQTLDAIVKKTLNASKTKSSPENRKSQWEFLLKNDIFVLAVGYAYNLLKWQRCNAQC
jgi:hypothetical protein